jgi:uncharacterized repeat protein (TIGR01451 family)
MTQAGSSRFRPALGVAFLAATTLLTATAAWAGQDGPQPEISLAAAQQMRVLTDIKAATKGGVLGKLDSRLSLGVLHLRKDARLAPLTDFRFVKPEGDGRVPVDVILTAVGGAMPVVEKVKALGGVVRASNPEHRRVSGRLRLEDLEALAAMPEVLRVRQAIPAFTHAVNVSEGDLTHGAQGGRHFFGVNGSGVKVCVLSDGVNSLAALQASGDLPPGVDVLPGQAGSGHEGSAMLEIVHDLAPGAALGFATAITGEATFAQNILNLAAAGCNVIVDDIIYLDESPFQDGPVAQAVNTVTAGGVLYFSSAGNEGNRTDNTAGTWEGDFLPNGTPPALAGAGPVHNFGDGGQSIRVEAGGGDATPLILIWAEHYTLSTGIASTDFDLYVMDAGLTTIFDASVDIQNGVGGNDFPIEFIGETFSGDRLVVARFAAGTTSSVPMFNLIAFRGVLDSALQTPGATRGHSAAAAAFSVAATPAAAPFATGPPPGPYPGPFHPGNVSEIFTSDGPRRIILSPTGAELTPGNRTRTGGVVRQKPDITAADGVSCAAPGFGTFYGTSASAPHAAAIAALMKSAVPALTPAQVRTALVNTAIDIETPGVDRDTGAGIIMAREAMTAAGAVQPIRVVGTKTVSGTFRVGSNVTYTVVLTNTGVRAQADNPGDEFGDALPSSLTLVSATATAGTATAAVATNTVTWNGVLAAGGGSVTITITAIIKPAPAGTLVSNQGTIHYDANADGTGDTLTTTDNPAVGGTNDPTSFTVAPSAFEASTKTVQGFLRVGGTVTYTVTITNSGNITSADNPGNEFVDVLPAGLTLVSATATSGTAVATVATNTVTWNGSLAAAASVTITITATINAGTVGTSISNQGTVSYDVDGNGSNETTTLTDDPAVIGAQDPTRFVVLVGTFFTVTPCRVVDTRSTAPIAAGATLTVTVRGVCGIPATARVVVLNATVTQTQAPGFVTLYPADQGRPGTSVVNFTASQARANNAIALLAPATGELKAFNGSAGTVQLILDVSGYFE